MNNPSGTKMLTDKLTRWKLAIQHMNFDIKHIEGVNNMVADLFSRLVFDNSRAVRREIGDPRPMEATSTDVSRHKYTVGAMCVRREQEVPSTEAQHQSEYEG
jgi:hypothetical protein